MTNILFTTSTITDGNMSFRFGETDAVVSNRRRFLQENDADYKDCVCMACDHGSKITSINRSNFAAYFGATSQESQPQSEVLVTNEPGVVLMVLTADCLPVLFHDPVHNVIALAHLNRKTIAHDLGQKTVGFLTAHYDTDPNNLHVFIGPHIKKESYSFALPLLREPLHQLREHTQEADGVVSIDLPAAETSQLTAIGALKENIIISSTDVAKDDQYFSHHRSKTDQNHPNGRMATIAVLR